MPRCSGDWIKGAEAVLRRVRVLGLPAVEKLRIAKEYRNKLLDERIRRERTRREARLLSRAKESGVLCPTVYEVSDFAIIMKFLEGKMLYHEILSRKVRQGEISSAAKILVALHSKAIVHGDFTPANLMNTRRGMAVIDFGLGSISPGSEGRGTDIVTMKKALGKEGERFVEAYAKSGGNAAAVRMSRQIESRARYMERG